MKIIDIKMNNTVILIYFTIHIIYYFKLVRCGQTVKSQSIKFFQSPVKPLVNAYISPSFSKDIADVN